MFIWSIFTVKASKQAFLCFLAKVVPGKVLFIDKKILDQNFRKKISFWIIFFVQRLIFWIKTFKRVILRAIFYNSTIFESTILDESDFEQTSFTTDRSSKRIWLLKKQILMNVLLAKNLFWNFLSHKTPTSAVICFLKNHDKEKKWIKSSFWMKNL